MIPQFKPLIDPLTTRFPAAWAKCKAPHDDGEFNARVCSVLYYEHGMTFVGRNGKRGNPADLSKDIINWASEGQNYDPTNGNAPCMIVDFIAGHESSSARIDQFYPDPDGPGAWVQPLTLAQIDAQYGGSAPSVPVIPGREEMMNAGKRLETYYKSPEGLSRPLYKPSEELVDWEGVGAWLFDVYLMARVNGKTVEEANAATVKAIRQTPEWQAKHPGETP